MNELNGGSAPADLKHAQRSLSIWIAVALWMVLLLLVFAIFYAGESVPVSSSENAMEAIKLMKDWSSWMAGVQTATLAALGILAKDGVLNVNLTRSQTNYLMATVVFSLFALFFSAWVLTSTSSLALRLPCAGSACASKQSLDFYNFTLYEIFPSSLSVAFFVTCNHWLWGASIISFGMLTIAVIVGRGPRRSTDCSASDSEPVPPIASNAPRG